MSKSPFALTLVLVGILYLSLSATTHAQSYFDRMSGIINEGQAAESQMWEAFNRSVEVAEYAADYVRSAGGDTQAFNRYIRRQANLNARDRNSIFTYDHINRVNGNIHRERGRSMEQRHRLIGDELAGTAIHHNQWGKLSGPDDPDLWSLDG